MTNRSITASSFILYSYVVVVLLFNRIFGMLICEKTFDDGCRCFSKNFTHWSEKPRVETTCCCKGSSVSTIPANLSFDMKHLYMKNVGLNQIQMGDFVNYTSLEVIEITEAQDLHQIDAAAFAPLEHLTKLSIKKCSSLRHVEGVLRLNNSRILILSFSHNALHDLPLLTTARGSLNLPTIDFSFNEIRLLKTRSLQNVEAMSVDLSFNKIDVIEDFAILNAKLGVLKLDHNPLTKLSNRAFANASTLRNLSMSNSEMPSLPEEGLEHVKQIVLTNNPNLKQLPSIFMFTNLEEAHLTYPYHCCLFKHAEVPKTSATGAKYIGNIDELSRKYCQPQETIEENDHAFMDFSRSTPEPRVKRMAATPIPDTATTFSWNDFKEDDNKNVWADDFDDSETHENSPTWGSFEKEEERLQNESMVDDHIKRHGNWIPTAVSIKNKQIATFCNSSGFVDLKIYYSKIACYPEPDPLNPCEDVVGFVWLRSAIWFVWIMAILGNALVMIILCAARQRSSIRVNHFLMMNLAFADFCTGVYMAMLAVQDARTAGAYYNYAVDWQTGWGCSAAGFLAVFASELSIFTMATISFELWYNTKYVFYGSRLRMSVAALIMAFGWIFALTMSILPVMGVFSSYSATSTCLPLRVTAMGDKLYLVIGLGLNVFGFAYIVFNYVRVYCMVAGTNAPAAQTQDMAIAKRMAVLIGTDFICWAPTIFFGLTAAGDVPLISVSVAKIFLVLFYPINAFANPFLYVLLTKMIRKDMSRLARKHPWIKKVSVWTRSSSRSSSLWSYSQRGSSRSGATKSTSLSTTLTSWMSSNSVQDPARSVSQQHKSLKHTKSLPNQCLDPGFDESEENNSSQQPQHSSILASTGQNRRRSSKAFKTRFSENVESFTDDGIERSRENYPLKRISSDDGTQSPLIVANDNVPPPQPEDEISYWYKKKLSLQKFFSDKVDKSLLVENERNNNNNNRVNS